MRKLNVAVIFGGRSAEHEVSVKSAIYIISKFSYEKYNVIPIYITQDGKWMIYSGKIVDFHASNLGDDSVQIIFSTDKSNPGIFRVYDNRIQHIKVDVVFPALLGMYGEDGTIQGLFELTDIPYVGCGVFASSVCMDKTLIKSIVESCQIPQPKSISYEKTTILTADKYNNDVINHVGYPCFIKPARLGTSIGIRRVTKKEELSPAIEHAFMFDRKIIIEELINGRELKCAVLGSGGEDTEASVMCEVKKNRAFIL